MPFAATTIRVRFWASCSIVPTHRQCSCLALYNEDPGQVGSSIACRLSIPSTIFCEAFSFQTYFNFDFALLSSKFLITSRFIIARSTCFFHLRHISLRTYDAAVLLASSRQEIKFFLHELLPSRRRRYSNRTEKVSPPFAREGHATSAISSR